MMIFLSIVVSVPAFVFLLASRAFVFQVNICSTFDSIRNSGFDLGIRYSEYFNPQKISKTHISMSEM